MNDDPIAALDQAMRGLTDAARVMRAYYVALIEEGFARDEALALTLAFQSVQLAGGSE